MVLHNYQNLIEMTSNINDIVAFGVGFKCTRKIQLETQWGGGKVGEGVQKAPKCAYVIYEWYLAGQPNSWCL